ncbi:MAG: hypothetical protein MN733_23315 [Nitrososphaera sp.]|nr:hypothetical protein [Nitrososphaera sp.]
MSLLGQINIAHSVGRIRSISNTPFYVKGLTYDRVYQRFERPHDALGNRFRNPVARVYDFVLNSCLSAFRRIFSPLARIEITIRMRPE